MSLDRGDSDGIPQQQQQTQQQPMLLPPAQLHPQLQQQRTVEIQDAAVVAASSGPQKSSGERNMIPEKENAKDLNGSVKLKTVSVKNCMNAYTTRASFESLLIL